MDWEIVWTEAAVTDLEPIVRTAASHSPATAESLRAELLESVEVLARFPLIGPTYERDRTGAEPGGRRLADSGWLSGGLPNGAGPMIRGVVNARREAALHSLFPLPC
jgi:plasmid stabilization system protein ParE